MSLNLNQTLQNKYPHLEISVLNYSDAMKDNDSKRIDSEFFKREYLENEKNSELFSETIGNICDKNIQNIKNLNLNKNFNYLQISDTDISNGLIYQTIETDFNEIPDRATYVLQNNDICVSTVRPNRNAVAFIQSAKRIVGTSGFCVLRLNTNKILPSFLYIFCKTDFFITKMMRANTASLYPAVLNSDIYKCKIPLFPLSFQQEIENLVKTSHEHLERSKDLYKQAEVLLYTELGLNPQNPLDFIEKNLSGSLKAITRHSDTLRYSDTFRHSERSEESRSQNENQDSSPTAQNDEVKTTHNDEMGTAHNDGACRHSECSNSETKNLNVSTENQDSSPTAQNDEVKTAHNDGVGTAQNDDNKYAHLNISVRTLKQSFLTTGRLDSEYYQNKYDEIERVIKNYRGGYGKISDYFKQNKKSESFTLSEYKYIEIGDINTGTATANYNIVQTNDLPANAKILLNNGDLLISKVRPNRGAVAIINFDETDLIGSGAFCVLQEIGEIKKEVLMILLRTPLYKEWLLKFNVGISYPVIKDEDILNLIIPKITKQTQTQIADLIKQSFSLRKSASDLLQTAKQKVETAIEKN